ncbi:MAG: hypothetical protein ABI851_01550 [Saprospiraceae bacterium]
MNKFILAFLLFSSCYQLSQEKIDQATQIQLEERKKNYFTSRLDDCTRNIQKEAQSIADSLLRIESKQSKMDSIRAPHDTLKPMKPELVFPDYKKPTKSKLDSSKSGK